MKLSEMTAADILASEQFESNVTDYLRLLTEQRRSEVARLKRHGQGARATLFDWLEEQGLTLPLPFIEAFMSVIEKNAKNYTVRQRTLIHAIGMEAYRRTMIEFKNAEKSEENSK